MKVSKIKRRIWLECNNEPGRFERLRKAATLALDEKYEGPIPVALIDHKGDLTVVEGDAIADQWAWRDAWERVGESREQVLFMHVDEFALLKERYVEVTE